MHSTTPSNRFCLALASSLLFACSAAPIAPIAPPKALASASSSPPPAPIQSASSSASAIQSAAPATPPPAPALVEWSSTLHFERVVADPIRAFSLDLDSWATVLGDTPWVYDGKTWTRLQSPPQLQNNGNEQFQIGIYLGRDNRARIMGSRWESSQGNAHASPIYLRFKNGRWQPDPKEIGRLGKAPFTGLFGVLGNADPEVVCKVGDACIIKRRTGWTTLPGVRELARVWLCNGIAFSLDSKGMRVLDQAVWTNLSWEFEGRGKETGFWATSAQNYWVSAASENTLYRFDGKKWDHFASPVQKPGALWASSANDVWVVGENGAAHFDGTTWSKVKGLDMPLEHVSGRNQNEVWLGGPKGLWRGKP